MLSSLHPPPLHPRVPYMSTTVSQLPLHRAQSTSTTAPQPLPPAVSSIVLDTVSRLLLLLPLAALSTDTDTASPLRQHPPAASFMEQDIAYRPLDHPPAASSMVTDTVRLSHLTAHRSQSTVHQCLPTAHRSQSTARRFQPTTHRSPPTVHRSLPTVLLLPSLTRLTQPPTALVTQ
jgi:hypothetical protein